LLTNFRNAPLLDAYDIYQHLMDYWAEAMQDDCYLIAADGWVAQDPSRHGRGQERQEKGRDERQGMGLRPDPQALYRRSLFRQEQAELDALQNELDAVSASLTELAEEHGGEEGALKDVSTKGDAQEAYTQALVAVWNEEDKTASRAYSALMDLAEEHAAQIRVLTDHHVYFCAEEQQGQSDPQGSQGSTCRDQRSEGKRDYLASYLEADKATEGCNQRSSLSFLPR
jgi:type I restriction enzyme M protein